MKLEDEKLKSRVLAEYFSFHELLGGGDVISLHPTIKILPDIKAKDGNLPNSVVKLSALIEDVKKFEGCALKRFAINTVTGEGVEDAPILIIGEAPGEEEDVKGVPFCGRSGRLLERALNRIGLFRDKNFYITNSVYWRPPGNRKPEEEELSSCRPFLERMIKIIRPKIILCIGSVSISNAIFSKDSVSSLRRKEFKFKFMHEPQEDFTTITFYHPSYLLRNPIKKREMYLDMLWFLKKYKGVW